MKSWMLALSLATMTSALGCAASTDGEPTDPRATPSAEAAPTPEATARRTAPRRAHLGGAAAAFPPRVDVPVAATRSEVCSHDDGDVKKAFRDYVRAQGGTVKRPSADVSTWPYSGGAYTCEYCDLDGMELYVPLVGEVNIWNSSMAGTRFDSVGTRLDLENVYARGAKIYDHVSFGAYNTDLRCADLQPADPDREAQIWQGQGVDFSGTTGTIWMRGAYVSDARFTGSAARIVLDGRGSALIDPRLDGLAGTIALSGGFLDGDVALDGSRVDVVAKDMSIGARFHFGGAKGTLRVSGTTTFDAADLTAPHDGFRVAVGPGAVRATNGTRWPVGSVRVLPSDAELVKIDFAGAAGKKGASLVAGENERWPSAPLDLSDLRLSRGALPERTDVSLLTLERAKLAGVDLARFTLEGTASHPTRLAHADLELADLGGASIEHVDLSHADLRGANLAEVSGTADLSYATAGVLPPGVGANTSDLPQYTSFERAVLGASRFDHAQLQQARFTQANLVDVHFEGATLDGARLDGAHLSKAEGQIANQTLASAASVHAMSFDGADLRSVDLAGLDFGPLAGARASFVGAYLCDAKLTGTKLRDADLSGMFFDVAGNIRAPGTGELVACRPGDRAGADTSTSVAALGTRCPSGGRPQGPAGQCSAEQWRVPGERSCTDEQTANALDEGAPCRIDCDCQSLACGPGGKCE
jgi:uncharacterized protein YjbI with pentapeptide repeats